MLYEKIGRKEEAAGEYSKYLELAPNATDSERFRRRLEALKGLSSSDTGLPKPPQEN
jgi:regulator of sirC expression with transglutaminase-like and TPR domain